MNGGWPTTKRTAGFDRVLAGVATPPAAMGRVVTRPDRQSLRSVATDGPYHKRS